MTRFARRSIKYGDTGSCYTVLDRDTSVGIGPSAFSCELHFQAVGVDPTTGEEEGDSFEEEYAVEDLEISTSDFIAKVNVGDFRRSWEQLGNTCEVLQKFALSFRSVEEATENVIKFFGMSGEKWRGAKRRVERAHSWHLDSHR